MRPTVELSRPRQLRIRATRLQDLNLPKGAILHTDRRSNNISAEFAALKGIEIRQTVGRTEIRYDNACRIVQR